MQETKRQTKGLIPISIPLRAYHLDGAVNRNPFSHSTGCPVLLAVCTSFVVYTQCFCQWLFFLSFGSVFLWGFSKEH